MPKNHPVEKIDVLVVVALSDEFEAAREVGLANQGKRYGVARWEERSVDSTPFLWGRYRTEDGRRLSVALARSTRTGGRTTSPLTTVLTDRLRPTCLAMCGVCAGNPAETVPGDVVVAETAYQWDEGQHRQVPLGQRWVRAAQDLDPTALAGYGPADPDESTLWLLEQLHAGQDPRRHHARRRYIGPGTWSARLDRLEADGLVTRDRSGRPELTRLGRARVRRRLDDRPDPPRRLPFEVVLGPMASGSATVADDTIWGRLAGTGVRTTAAVDTEAATIATVAEQLRVPDWLVVKGVTDSAGAPVDDRYRPFAARASAEVLFALLARHLPQRRGASRRTRLLGAGVAALVLAATTYAGVTSLQRAPDDGPAPRTGSLHAFGPADRPSAERCATSGDDLTVHESPDAGVFTEFCLPMNPGTPFDLDLEPGRPVTGRSHSKGSYPDVYLSTDPMAIYGFSREPNGPVANPVWVVRPTAAPADCRAESEAVTRIRYHFLDGLTNGSKLCVFTYDHRWAMLHVAATPDQGSRLVRLYVVVLDS
jgi:nucleoside phosphorylase